MSFYIYTTDIQYLLNINCILNLNMSILSVYIKLTLYFKVSNQENDIV